MNTAMHASLAGFSPEFALLFSALLLMAFEFLFPRQRGRMTVFALAGVVIALALTFQNAPTERITAFGGAVVFDPWTTWCRAIILASAAASLILALPRTGGSGREDSSPGFSLLILFSAAGANVMASSNDFLVTLIAIETMSLPLYAMMILADTRKSLEGSVKYFLMGAAASAVMIFGISILVGASGTTRYDMFVSRGGALYLGAAVFAIGLLFKLASAPFHAWMPDVYESAPAPVAVFMGAGVKTAALAALVRLLPAMVILAGADRQVRVIQFFAILAMLSMVVGNGGALLQTSLTRLIGYSSIAHTGFLLMALAASAAKLTPEGLSAAGYYLAAYAPAVIAAFAVAALIDASEGSDPFRTGGRKISDLHGLSRRHPLLAAALAVSMASLAGFPPAVGFWAKLRVLVAAYRAEQMGLIIIALLNSLLAAYYYVVVIAAAYRDPEGKTAPSRSRAPLAVVVLILAASLFILGSGIIPGAMMRLSDSATGIFR